MVCPECAAASVAYSAAMAPDRKPARPTIEDKAAAFDAFVEKFSDKADIIRVGQKHGAPNGPAEKIDEYAVWELRIQWQAGRERDGCLELALLKLLPKFREA